MKKVIHFPFHFTAESALLPKGFIYRSSLTQNQLLYTPVKSGIEVKKPTTSQAALHDQSEFIKRNGHLDHGKLHVGIGTEENVQTSVNERSGLAGRG